MSEGNRGSSTSSRSINLTKRRTKIKNVNEQRGKDMAEISLCNWDFSCFIDGSKKYCWKLVNHETETCILFILKKRSIGKMCNRDV